MEPSENRNQLNPPESLISSNKTIAMSTPKRSEGGEAAGPLEAGVRNHAKSVALLLDLSGNDTDAISWVTALTHGATIKTLDRIDLKWTSRREALRLVRSLKPRFFCVYTSDLRLQSGTGALMLFAILAGAQSAAIGDSNGRVIVRSRLEVLLLVAPRYALELVIGYGLLVPLSWLLIELLGLTKALRAIVRSSRRSVTTNPKAQYTALYVRATLSSSQEGGMPSHISGFTNAAASLGHHLRFVVSSTQDNRDGSSTIMPSLSFNATKVLLELWNNVVFSVKSLQFISLNASRKLDFIYQRYSRFNCTGVLLSTLTGLPLALEFNGSEVWLGKQWDPIGLLWLLKRFERLNLRVADLIFVVSDVEHHNLTASGIDPSKIIVNANGVDPERFHPECGGRELRRSLGIDDNKIVVGFVGTFGPWHGAPVLAEAAIRISGVVPPPYFLFIGTGEQRKTAQTIIDSTPNRVTARFTGRLSHNDVPAHLDACDILVSPTVRSEDGSEFFGSPTKLFEYMAISRPVIGSRVGQIAQVIDHDINGLLVEPGDPEALARAIERLAQDKDLRERLGAAARKTVIEHYTWKHNAARVFDIVGERFGCD